MAVARIVMQDWKDNFKIILENSQIAELLIGLYVDDGRSLQRLLVHGERFSEKDSKIVMMEDEKISDGINDRDRIELTKTEMLRAMNSVSTDLEFTMELCRDFADNMLPTLSFSLYASDNGISHTYFEKMMKNQTLVMSRSAISRNQIMNIISNELIRILEVTSTDASIEEKIRIIEKYTQH